MITRVISDGTVYRPVASYPDGCWLAWVEYDDGSRAISRHPTEIDASKWVVKSRRMAAAGLRCL